MIYQLLIGLISLILISGCSTIPTHTPQQLDWQQREAELQQFSSWQLEGRIAIRTEDDSWSGSLQWQQLDSLYDIKFSGPFGQGAVSLTGDQYRVVLSSSEGNIVGREGPEQLMYEQLGWLVPISNLQYWVVGRPNPTKYIQLQEFDEFGRVKSLKQDDWHVSFRRYRQFQQLEIPDKISIENHRLKVKLVVDQWQKPNNTNKEI